MLVSVSVWVLSCRTDRPWWMCLSPVEEQTTYNITSRNTGVNTHTVLCYLEWENRNLGVVWESKPGYDEWPSYVPRFRFVHWSDWLTRPDSLRFIHRCTETVRQFFFIFSSKKKRTTSKRVLFPSSTSFSFCLSFRYISLSPHFSLILILFRLCVPFVSFFWGSRSIDLSTALEVEVSRSFIGGWFLVRGAWDFLFSCRGERSPHNTTDGRRYIVMIVDEWIWIGIPRSLLIDEWTFAVCVCAVMISGSSHSPNLCSLIWFDFYSW